MIGQQAPRFDRCRRLALSLTIAGAAAAGFAATAQAQVTVGASLSLTGPGSALGIPMKQGLELWPTEIAGQKINLIILDDASDPSQATRNARKFSTENKADLLLGSNLTPSGMAVSNVAQETQTPHMAFAPIPLAPGKSAFSFVVPQSVSLMAKATAKDMLTRKIRKLGFIGFSDPWGEQWLAALTKELEGSDVKIVANEKYGRSDTSVTGQVLKLISAQPDAIFIAGSGTGAALPQTALAERNYKGQVYQSHGAGSKDFLRIAGKAAEGALLPIGPVLLPKQLPSDHPSKKVVNDFSQAFFGKYGPDAGIVFGAHAFDATAILSAALPAAIAKAKPGTPEFRLALRDAIEASKNVAGTNGVYNFSKEDHYGLDERGAIMVKVVNGDWQLVK
ncbi:MAG: ABC transporter substrate-binding protein [Burkholderiaceae bacterium]